MGDVAELMVNGDICQICGVYLHPSQKVYVYGVKVKMPENGEGYGVPVTCKDCHSDERT